MDKQQTRVFASVLAAPARDMEPVLAPDRDRDRPPAPRPRELQVTGSAELCSPADRASVRVRVSSRKETMSEASDSVTRRLDYILQCFRQHGVKDDQTLMRKFLHREENLYLVNVEVNAAFSDFTIMEQVCQSLLEKLDKSVVIGPSQYYHSPECLDQLRRRVCTFAAANAQKKAVELSGLLGQTLGPPLLVAEEENREAHGDFRNGARPPADPLYIPSVTAFSRVSITFGLRDKIGKRLEE